jgi:pyruvate dehydrogenase E2 component (dihydrolipoamide acetyltransferase)
MYGDMDIDAAPILEYIDKLEAATGVKSTVTHAVGRGLALTLAEHPDANTRLFLGRLIPRDTVDVFFIVASNGGNELSGVKVVGADKKSLAEIAVELADRAKKIRRGDDADLGATKGLLSKAPPFVVGAALKLTTLLTTDLDLDLRRFGLPYQTFGSVMVTSVGMFGVQHGYAALAPYHRVPALVLVSEVQMKPVVVAGEVIPRPILTLSATMDHRYFDGYHVAAMSETVKTYLEHPEKFEPPLPE